MIERLEINLANGRYQGPGSSASPGVLFGCGAAAGEGGSGTGPNASTTSPGLQGGGGGVQDAGDYETEDDPSGVFEDNGELLVDYFTPDGVLRTMPTSPLQILQFKPGTANPQERLKAWVITN